MTSTSTSDKPVGVLGAGNFGTAIASLLSKNADVLIYARNSDSVKSINERHIINGHSLKSNVRATNDLQELAKSCTLIFPIVPSSGFRGMMKDLAPCLRPYHILIHGTKGVDVSSSLEKDENLSREHIKTMSEVIREESVVERIGCLAGPNLASELLEGQPAATVVASHYDEVIREGIRLLRNDRFQVYSSSDLIGVELGGVLKNIIAIAAGALSGMELGDNARALLISRGMVEMIYLGRMLGGNINAFIGLAGVGDLIATCSSPYSRNYSVGFNLAKGEKLENILDKMDETAEGINTIRIIKSLAENYKVRAPITENLYKVLFENMSVETALQYLMKYPFNTDIDFL